MPNSGSNNSELHAAAGVIDHTIDDASPTLEGSDIVTDKVPNSGAVNTNPIMNAYPVEIVVMERKSITLETTLAASTHEHHVRINLEKKQSSPSMVESGEWPKNIRSWRCIIRQPCWWTRQVSKEDVSQSQILAKAVPQPRQMK